MRRLSGFDTAALALETDASPLHMTAVIVLDTTEVPGGYSYERLRDFLAARIHRVQPLLQQLARVPGEVHRPVWVDVPTIDWDYHLPRTIVTEPLDTRRLAEITAELAEQRLDLDHPLWQMNVAEEAAGGRVAIIARVHHALMDGRGGMEFMAALFDVEANEPEREAPTIVEVAAAPSRAELLGRAVIDLTTLPAAAARFTLNSLRTLAGSARARSDAQSVARPFTAPSTPFNGRLTSTRSVAFTELSFERVRNVAARNGAKVNDVVLAVVSGAMRTYLSDRGLLPERRLIAGVPAATELRNAALANRFSFLLIRLATDVEDPAERLAVVMQESSRAKRTADELGTNALAELLDVFTPLPLDALLAAYRALLVGRIPPLWNVVVSNVPGPPVTLFVAGARLVGLYPLGPIYDGLGLNVTVLSREQSLDVGIVACREMLTEFNDLEALAALLQPALDELASATPVPV